MFQWLRALKQTTTGLGLLTIVVLWSGVFLLASQEREHASQSAEQRGRSLARVFEEYISRVIKETDSQLRLLRKLYQQDSEHFDFAIWTDGARDLSDLTLQFSITRPDGIIRLSTLGPIQSKADISHSDAFSAHMNSAEDQLLIGKPTIGLISGKPSVNLTRRLTAPDGSFDGIIAASLDVLQLEAFYNSVDVGKGGVIVLVGLDGIIRARSGRGPAAAQFIGESASRTKWFERSRQSPEGNYWSLGNTPRQFSTINRLMSFRVVEGLPLIAAVGLAESDIFEKSISTASLYYRNGSLLTVFVLVAIAIGARRQMQLTSVTSSLKQTNGNYSPICGVLTRV
jgi:two-component system, sensor histidine kinase